MSSLELCSVCEKPVVGSSRIRSNGRVFHEDCFKCSNCGCDLDSCFFKNGKLYCDPCETDLFAKKCDKCKLPIQTTVVSARGRNFHNECFTCACCQKILKGSFFYIAGQFICDDCDSKGLQPPPLPANTIPTSPTPTSATATPQAPTPTITTTNSITPPMSPINIISGSITPIIPVQPVQPINSVTTIDSRTNVEIPGANIVLSQVPSNSTNVIYVMGGSNNNLPQFSNDSPPNGYQQQQQQQQQYYNQQQPLTPPNGYQQSPPNGYQQQQQQQQQQQPPYYQPQQSFTPPNGYQHQLQQNYRGSGNFISYQQNNVQLQPIQRNTGDFLPSHYTNQQLQQQPPKQQYHNNQETYQQPPNQIQPQIQRNTGDFIPPNPNGQIHQRNTGDHLTNQYNQPPPQQQPQQPYRNTGDFLQVPNNGSHHPQNHSSISSSPITSANSSASTSPISPHKVSSQSISTLKLSHDPLTEKHIPKIQGKTLQELLKYNSFDEILNDILRTKTQVHNHINKDEVEFGELIAAGASGKVHTGKWRGKEVAIKVYSADNIYFSREEFDREVSIMSLLDNESFATFYGANCENPKYLFHLTELVKRGSLRDNLLNKDLQLSYAQKVSIALDIAGAMKYVHSLGIIHRDLKSGNVLLTDDIHGKVIDFGTSRAIDLSKQMTLNLGTSCWMAPEVFRNQPYTESCDVYSFAIVLWEIFCRKDPYDGVNSWSIPIMVTKGERPAIPDDCPSDYSKLMKACWEDKPKKRPKFKEINATLMKILGGLTISKKKSGFFGK